MNHTDELGDLVIGVYKNLKTKIDRDLKGFEIGMGQLQILMVFFSEMDRSFTQNELVKALGVDKGNISRSLVKLSAKGYLEQVDSPRSYMLSRIGKLLKSEIITIFISINKTMTQEVELAELHQTIITLKKLRKNLEEAI